MIKLPLDVSKKMMNALLFVENYLFHVLYFQALVTTLVTEAKVNCRALKLLLYSS